MKPLASLLPALLGQCAATDQLTEQAALALWKGIVGEPLARRTRPTQLRRSRLLVMVPSVTWSNHLSSLQREIVNRLNQALGTRISGLDFCVDSRLEQLSPEILSSPPRRSPTPVSLPLEAIEDDELRARVQAAATTYFDRGK